MTYDCIADPRLRTCAAELDPAQWAAFLLDADFRLVWVSDELKEFVGEHDECRLGYGSHIADVVAGPVWSSVMTAESRNALLERGLPFVLQSLPSGAGLSGELHPDVAARLEGLVPQDPPPLWTGRFGYHRDGVRLYDVQYVVHELRTADGERIGTCVLTYVAVRPNLLALLARGDQPMYERMSRLLEPKRHPAAILFADLEASVELARRLPTAVYFALISRLTTEFDRLVAGHKGVVGKHVGDGMTAFFLAEDAGSPYDAASAALGTARTLQTAAADILTEVACGSELAAVNIGLHWGSSLYIGQLVPGGRLDITALGDEVNECARIQETAHGGRILASKAFAELLEAAPGAADLTALRYTPLAHFESAGPKVHRDAAGLPVTEL